MEPSSWLLYGANGYTGRRIAQEAVARGWMPILAGRNAREITALAERLRCPSRVFALDDHRRLVEQLQGVRAVLHCAGPFSATAAPMMDACLEARVHYLDITGEIAVIEAAADRHDRAVEAGVALLPAVGFDVVPSDCLAAMLAERVPGATQLQLAFTFGSRVSPGTARTIAEGLGHGGKARINGRIVTVPIAWKTMLIPFREGSQPAVTVPWGDVATAWHTTGIPNIEVYAALPERQAALMRRFRRLFSLLKVPGIGGVLGYAVRTVLHQQAVPEGESGRASFWGRVSDDHGRTVEATMETPEGYRLTVLTALAAVERVLSDGVSPGFWTPARAFGPHFILSIPETDMQWDQA
jgi:saccharopine dehydrogenase (NAD+, L-lysine-forming)